MSACRRFEEEGLLRLERGLPLEAHFASCPDCLAARAAYEHLGGELAAAGAGLEPPPGWQAEVRAALRAREAARRPWRVPWILLPAAAALLAAVLVTVVARQVPVPVARVALRVEVEAAPGTVLRGTEAHPGDRLHLEAATGGAPHAELRVYRNDRTAVLRCSSEPPCERRTGTLEATFVLPSIGSYQPLLLTSDRPLPAPAAGANLDADVGRALAAGARVTLGTEIEAR